MLLIVLSSALPADAAEDPACLPHPPIFISGDDDFVIPGTGGSVYAPGSGVTAGSGTADDPYIIEGWCITAGIGGSAIADRAIWLHDTTAHVVIRLNSIGNPLEPTSTLSTTVDDLVEADVGILVEGVANVVVEENDVRDNLVGIAVQGGTDVQLRANLVRQNDWGIGVEGSPAVVVVENEVQGNAEGGIRVRAGSDDALVARNNVSGNVNIGIVVSGSARILVEDNIVHDQWYNVWGVGATDLVVRRNNITANINGIRFEVAEGIIEDNHIVGTFAAVRLIWSADVQVRYNLAEMGWYGLLVESPQEGIEVTNNRFERNKIGTGFDDGIALLRDNHIVGNDLGLRTFFGSGPVDARHNWWGCAAGPGAPGCDTVDPLGIVDPWLTAPGPAGPR